MAPSRAEVTIGSYSESYTATSATVFNANDRIFSVGNGSNQANRSNALTILKNGNTGLGDTTPEATLDVEGTLQYVDGNQASGRVLTSDADGNASWQDIPSSFTTPSITSTSSESVISALLQRIVLLEERLKTMEEVINHTSKADKK